MNEVYQDPDSVHDEGFLQPPFKVPPPKVEMVYGKVVPLLDRIFSH